MTFDIDDDQSKLVTVLDYGAGNITSLLNALDLLGHPWKIVAAPQDLLSAQRLVFPGVGSFDSAISALHSRGLFDPLLQYLRSDKPFLGICVGMQVLFKSSDESPGVAGLGFIDAHISKLSNNHKSVPHIGWSNISTSASSTASATMTDDTDFSFYFVHSFALNLCDTTSSSSLSDTFDGVMCTRYVDETIISGIRKGNIFATQFHPEKSGKVGLDFIDKFLKQDEKYLKSIFSPSISISFSTDKPRPRIIACMDVCEDESGELVVTKGDSYNILDSSTYLIKNHGSPADFARIYYEQGADEIVFLNITGHKKTLLEDAPMLKLLKEASKFVYIPLTVGGGIRSYDAVINGETRRYSALEVADTYFRCGADKISIGSDAVLAAHEYLSGNHGKVPSAIEEISKKYGNQAVVVSIDPIRVYVNDPSETSHLTIETAKSGPGGEKFVWFQCTIHGGKKKCDLDVVQLVTACDLMGAGEFLVNSIDMDGKCEGYDLELMKLVRKHTSKPIIASSGAGKPQDFVDAFAVGVDACLAAGIFHRGNVSIKQVKQALNH